MALEWVLLAAAVAIEVVLLVLVTLPLPKAIVKTVVYLYKQILQPLLAILPFAAFQLLDVYWKYEQRMVCAHENCTATDRDRYEKQVYKSQRNAILALSALFLYWMLYRYVNSINELQLLETQVNRAVKDE